MEWYYAEGQKQLGPISDSEFRNLVENGTVVSDTLVWNSSMSEWTAYGELAGDPPSTSGETPVPDEGPKLYCSECGGAFSKDEMIQYENSWVCAKCKPVFIQKIKEGVGVARHMEYAGFWIRFGAKVIDGIIVMVIQMVIYLPFMGLIGTSMTGISSDQPPDMGAFSMMTGLMSLLQFAISIAYPTWFLGKYGATPGKMACKIKVVMSNGDKITYLRAFGRFFAEMLSYILLCIGYIMAAFDGQKRALHDHICDTRVVRK